MKSIKITSLLFFVLIFCSCDKQPEIINGETDIEAKLLWTSPISEGGLVNGVFYNQTFEDRLYVLGSKNNNPTLLAKNIDNGETVWEWSDWGNENIALIKTPTFVNSERMVAFSGGNYYDIDLTNDNISFLSEYSETYFYAYNTIVFDDELFHVGISLQSQPDSVFNSVFKRNLSTNEFVEFVVPNYTGENKNLRNEIGNISRLSGFKHNGKPKLLLSILESDSLWNGTAYISLYDIETQTWDYEFAELDYDFQESYTGSPIISGDFVYHTKGRLVTCHNVLTGELIWKQNLKFNNTSGGTSIGGFVVSEADNIMVVSTHSGERLTYGLNMTTGNIVWQTETTGGNGQKYALNGVVYFASYGDGELHALDIATGDYIWKIESPDNSSNNWFQGVLTGIPGENGEKGKIFTNSYLNAFCFEAAR